VVGRIKGRNQWAYPINSGIPPDMPARRLKDKGLAREDDTLSISWPVIVALSKGAKAMDQIR